MANIKVNQKKEWARALFVHEGLTQKEIAAKVGSSEVTISKWATEGKWKLLKQSILTTRQTQYHNILAQIEELNTHIKNKAEGQRFADSKEADALHKLTATARNFENEKGIPDIIEVSMEVLKYLRATSPKRAEEIARVFDDFIQEKLKH